jgi:hypothetical protein
MGKAIVTSNDSGESDVTPTESKTTGTVGNFAHGSRETPETSVSLREADRSEKARGHNSDMHAEDEKAFLDQRLLSRIGVTPWRIAAMAVTSSVNEVETR